MLLKVVQYENESLPNSRDCGLMLLRRAKEPQAAVAFTARTSRTVPSIFWR
jgi:hypothetical protein